MPVKRKMGAPTKFKPEYCQIAADCYAQGYTDFELAERLGTTARSLYRWQVAYPEFRQSLKIGREAQTDRVERSLYARAVGYSYPSVKILQNAGTPVVVPYTEHCPPDTGAAIFWLCNRRAEDWKQQKTFEVKHEKSDLQLIDAIIERFQRLKSTRAEAIEIEAVTESVTEPVTKLVTKDPTNGSNGSGE